VGRSPTFVRRSRQPLQAAIASARAIARATIKGRYAPAVK